MTAANGDTEGGAPTTILEAQACCVPIVSTRHADIPNVVADESAVLAHERDVEGLASALASVLDHPGHWDQMGLAGRAFVEKYHDVSNEVKLLEDKYFSLIKT